ncbi:MAG: SAM-dependent methyltransferase [Mariniblastus sp.]|jgi:SAM-dependent methyltransferase
MADWQIPPGVTKGNWEYAQAQYISTNYDQFLADDPLTVADRKILDRYFPVIQRVESPEGRAGPVVADFGCGNGRTLVPLLGRGYRGLGIDLSIPMLSGFAKKISESSKLNHDLMLVQANLVELEGFSDNTIDHAISLFSTLGMIAGQLHRAAFLGHVRRMLKPGGMFVMHAHNVWFQTRHPGGIRWVIQNAFNHVRGKSEFGDRTATYRSINEVFIHSFQKSTLEAELVKAGFRVKKWFGILPGSEEAVEKLPWPSAWRTIGWIVVCE